MCNLFGGHDAERPEPVADLIVEHQYVLDHHLIGTTFRPIGPDAAITGSSQSLPQGRADIGRNPIGQIEVVDGDRPDAQRRELLPARRLQVSQTSEGRAEVRLDEADTRAWS